MDLTLSLLKLGAEHRNQQIIKGYIIRKFMRAKYQNNARYKLVLI